MNTIQLECFMAVVEYLNFSKAAEAVKMTQPAVSHQINSLEDELKTKLFTRTSKKVELTSAGRHFISAAKTILNVEMGVKANLRTKKDDNYTLLAIGCHNNFETSLVAEILGTLRKLGAEFHPVVKHIPFRAMESMLEEGGIHVMFGYKSDQPKKSRTNYYELGRFPVGILCDSNNPLAEKDEISENELDDRLIMYEPRKMPVELLQIQNREATKRDVSQMFFSDSYESAVTLVKAGYGFSITPQISHTLQLGVKIIRVKEWGTISFGIFYKKDSVNDDINLFIKTAEDMVGI